MPSVAEFYSSTHIGPKFGETGPGWVGYHHGQDINRWPSGTAIPSYVSGTVVASFSSKTLGWVVIVQSGEWFYGFCHMKAQSPLKVGAVVAVGTIVGYLGSTGTASKGPHLHGTREPSIAIGTARATDPLPTITAALTAIAGGDRTPFTAPPEEDEDMRLKKNVLGFWQLYTANGMYVIVGQDAADRVWRCLYGEGAADAGDLNFLNSILYGPRWSWDAAAGSFLPNLPPISAAAAGPGGLSKADLDAAVASVREAIAAAPAATAAELGKRLGNG